MEPIDDGSPDSDEEDDEDDEIREVMKKQGIDIILGLVFNSN